MTTRPLVLERAGPIETWTINRPDQRNPITDEDVIEALVGAVERVDRDDSARVVILTGAGQAFSAGGNVRAMVERDGVFGLTGPAQRAGYRRGIQRLIRSVYEAETPFVAAVNGPAIGAGLDLALACDLRLAADTAVFAESFVKLGIVSGDGGSWLLSRTIGPARAAEMTLTGDPIDAQLALAWGLVSRVTDRESLLAEAQRLAGRIAENSPAAVQMSKRLLRIAQHSRLEDVLEVASSMQPLAHQTVEHEDALAALAARRSRPGNGR